MQIVSHKKRKKKNHLIHPSTENNSIFQIHMPSHSNEFAHVDSALNFLGQTWIIWNSICNKTWFINKKLSCIKEIRQAYKSGRTWMLGPAGAPLLRCGTWTILRDFPRSKWMTVLSAQTRSTWARQSGQGELSCTPKLCCTRPQPRADRGEEVPWPARPF